MRLRHETFGALFDMVYVALMTNILLVVGCLPLVVGLVATDPARSWPILALASPLCAPGLCAAFAVLSAYSSRRSATVVRTFGRSWRDSWRRATGLGALATALLVVMGVDARAAWGHRIGAFALPMLATAMVVTVATSLLTLILIAERPDVRLRDGLRACLYLTVRRWYLTLFSLVVLALLEALLVSRPAIALGLAAAPMLYVVWANGRFALSAALGPVTHQPRRA